MTILARWIFLVGVGLILLAGLLWIFARFDLPLGQLPGDFRWQRGSTSCFFPLATSLLLSGILTLLINLILRIIK